MRKGEMIMKNGVMLQGFEWYLPEDGNYYKNMMTKASEIKFAGFSSVWLPPVCKGTGTNDVGYGVYDLYDLGEFDQKGSVRTKYGTKEELHELLETLKNEGLDVYADVVLNHKAGGDRLEQFKAVEVDPDDRRTEIGQARDIKSWTGFDFLGRDGKYSQFKWNFMHFTGVGYDDITGEHGIYKILGENKGWGFEVSPENGNFDYLMFANIDHAHPDVKEELKKWVQWFIQETGVHGFRMDAVKHIDIDFFRELTTSIKEADGQDFYLFCEYWTGDMELIKNYVEETQHQLDLFDIPLHYNLQQASTDRDGFDLRTIFDGTIVQAYPTLAVTFVDNHDTQPRQSLESWVDPWFKEMAYALILLRKDGYPCVFYGDYFGIDYQEDYTGVKDEINRLMFLRQHYCFGDQDDYFQEANLIGWVRHGDAEHPAKAAIVLSNKEGGAIRMFIGEGYAGKTFIDQMERDENHVTIQGDGFGEFSTSSAGLSVWVSEEDA